MLKLSEIFLAVEAPFTKVNEDFVVNNIVTDSREVLAGDVFVALSGENFDGHDFCKVAIDKGAKVLIVARKIEFFSNDVILVVVEDTLKAYQKIASFYRDKFKFPIVAVTGSSGKTTTKDVIAGALKTSKKVLKSKGNFNNEIGLPKTLLELNSSYQVAVVEMGMRGLGQIEQLAKIAKPNIGVVTNVNSTHMELLGSLESIALAKGELIKELCGNSWAILNFDDEYVRQMSAYGKGKVIYFGLDNKADIYALDIESTDYGTKFKCINKVSNKEFMVYVPLLGLHNVYNTLAAIAVCTVLEIDVDLMLQGLSTIELSSMRQELERFNDVLFINDTYNASPASMQAALKLLSGIKGDKKVAVLSDMLELGGISESAHVKLGELVAENKIDYLISFGTMSKFTHEKARELGVSSEYFKDKQEAANYLYELLEKDMVILFKGSRGMRVEEVIKAVKEKFN